jgi:lysophospholipase L1-like esterase
MRVAINRWIRTGGGFDGWFDFDKAVRSVSNPDRLAHAYDSPDHTHLLDAGYQALADSIDLSAFH